MDRGIDVYYLTGMGGSLTHGLGQALIEAGCDVFGRELQGDFRKLPFAEKVATVVKDLRWLEKESSPRVIANSFGAYVFLHAQAELPAYSGRVLLLSPIVGAFTNEGVGIGFVPPRAKRLYEIAQNGGYPAPKNCEIHVGSEDWQCNPVNVTKFGELAGIPVSVVPDNGHQLDRTYVSGVLKKFLT